MSQWIWGWHSVEACLESKPELIVSVSVFGNPDDAKYDEKLVKLRALAEQVEVSIETPARAPKNVSQERNQGIAAELRTFGERKWHVEKKDILFELSNSSDHWVLLDRITDVHNYGAILRSAAAFGLKGVITQEKQQSPLSGKVAEVSTGHLFHLEHVTCKNLNHFVDLASEADFQVCALDMGGIDLTKLKPKIDPKKAVIWIMGSEGEGVSKGLLSRSTHTVSIPMSESAESLNVSNAAAITFFYSRHFLIEE